MSVVYRHSFLYIFLAAGVFLFSCASQYQAGEEEKAGERLRAYPLMEAGAIQAYYDGNVEESAGIFEELLRRETPDGAGERIRKELAFAYHEMGQAEKAAALLSVLLKETPPSDPSGAESRREEFIAYCLAGNTEAAQALAPLQAPSSESVFYEALLHRDMGNSRKAEELLKQSLAMQENRPMGWFFLGEVLAPSSPAEAEQCYKKALSQDAGFTFALFPLAEVLFKQERYKEAYGFFQRAKNSYPNHPGIAARIEEISILLPELTRGQEETRQRRRNAAVPPKVRALGKEAENLPLVRVGLAENLSSLCIKTGADYTITTITDGAAITDGVAGVDGVDRTDGSAGVDKTDGKQDGKQDRNQDGKSSYSGKALDQLFFEISGGEISVKDFKEKILITSREALVLSYQEAEATTIVFDFLSEAGSFFALTEDRSYRGSMEARPETGGISLINSLNIEEYLYSVIPSEMPASWPEEALKAQAIAHRSYTLAHLGQYAAKGFDVYGSVLSAAYRGAGGEAARTTAAVDASRGVYLTAGGKPLKAYYSANHGGYSEDGPAVWGGEDVFMAAVPDKLIPTRDAFLPLDELDRFIRGRPKSYSAVEKLHSPAAYRWEKWVPAEDIKNRVAAEASTGSILSIISRGRGISGRIREVEITGTDGVMRIPGDRIRSRLGGLRSNLFSIRSKAGKDGRPEYFIFQGAGWGHGVGLDQSGAAGMAQAGFSAGEILKHYYPRAAISREAP
ncbi:MAG: SpoIID/LytB domain-containing protein [Spirochaetales bacterium]|jgi:SpoIID/LytB domain protein|nr:SpoIID/LytB domain-containing protein [Spirochaetales bacterium]